MEKRGRDSSRASTRYDPETEHPPISTNEEGDQRKHEGNNPCLGRRSDTKAAASERRSGFE